MIDAVAMVVLLLDLLFCELLGITQLAGGCSAAQRRAMPSTLVIKCPVPSVQCPVPTPHSPLHCTPGVIAVDVVPWTVPWGCSLLHLHQCTSMITHR